MTQCCPMTTDRYYPLRLPIATTDCYYPLRLPIATTHCDYPLRLPIASESVQGSPVSDYPAESPPPFHSNKTTSKKMLLLRPPTYPAMARHFELNMHISMYNGFDFPHG